MFLLNAKLFLNRKADIANNIEKIIDSLKNIKTIILLNLLAESAKILGALVIIFSTPPLYSAFV